MKKILSLIVILFFSIVTFNSCEEPIPDCELYGYGEVTIKNSTGYEIKVDVTYTETGVNYEKWLNHGDSNTYKMDAGGVYIWASLDGYEWVFDIEYLSDCEHMTYTWYSTGKKSTSELYLEISNNGEVIETVTEFETIKRDL